MSSVACRKAFRASWIRRRFWNSSTTKYVATHRDAAIVTLIREWKMRRKDDPVPHWRDGTGPGYDARR
jgi:hypothetical protein